MKKIFSAMLVAVFAFSIVNPTASFAQNQDKSKPCYFGECDDKSSKNGNPSTPYPTDEDAPLPNGNVPNPPMNPQVRLSWVCQTPQMWCTMNAPGPVQSPCWCGSPYGPLYGIVIPQ